MNVVPYIDVMLVLVVILMVAAPYVNPSIVDLPKVNKAARTPDKVVEVIISPDGKLQIRDTAKKLTPVDFPQLVSTVESMQTTEIRFRLSLLRIKPSHMKKSST